MSSQLLVTVVLIFTGFSLLCLIFISWRVFCLYDVGSFFTNFYGPDIRDFFHVRTQPVTAMFIACFFLPFLCAQFKKHVAEERWCMMGFSKFDVYLFAQIWVLPLTRLHARRDLVHRLYQGYKYTVSWYTRECNFIFSFTALRNFRLSLRQLCWKSVICMSDFTHIGQ